MAKKPPKLPSDVMLLMPRVVRDWERRLSAALAERGMPSRPAHSAVMRNINPERGSRITDIARRAGMTKQAIGLLVASMEAEGLVECVPDPEDGRAKIVRMTTYAKENQPQVLEAITSIDREYAMLVGPARYAELEDMLRTILGWR